MNCDYFHFLQRKKIKFNIIITCARFNLMLLWNFPLFLVGMSAINAVKMRFSFPSFIILNWNCQSINFRVVKVDYIQRVFDKTMHGSWICSWNCRLIYVYSSVFIGRKTVSDIWNLLKAIGLCFLIKCV